MAGDVDGHWHLEEKGPAGIEDAKSRQKTHSGTSEKGNMYYFNDRMIGVKKLLTEFQTIKWGPLCTWCPQENRQWWLIEVQGTFCSIISFVRHINTFCHAEEREPSKVWGTNNHLGRRWSPIDFEISLWLSIHFSTCVYQRRNLKRNTNRFTYNMCTGFMP